MWATRTLIHLFTALLLFSSGALASPFTPGGPALFSRRNHIAVGRSDINANAAAAPHTNAGRFARGLGPLKPKNLFSPTRVRREGASPLPPITGYIAVYLAGTKTVRGYINPAAATPTLINNPPSTLTTYTPPAIAGAPVELNYVGQPARMAVGSSSGVPSLLSASSSNSARFLSTTASTPAGSVPMRESTSSARYLETTVWVVNPSTNAVTVAFVNYDGSQPSTQIVQQGAYLYITGSTSKFIATAPGALQVDLGFIPVSS